MSITPIVSIIFNTFKENIRNKVLYNILFVAVGVIVLSVSFGDWSVFARAQVMQDFGLATMSIASLMLAVFIGVGLLGKEIAGKTVYTVITKSVSRWGFVLGKFFGLLATLFVNCFLISAVLYLTVVVMGEKPQAHLVTAMVLVWVEMAVIVAAAILFSVLTTPALAVIFTLAFYVAGHWNDLVGLVSVQDTQPLIAFAVKAVYYLLPNLEHFNLRTVVVYGLPIPAGYVSSAVVYGVLYTSLLLVLACTVFNRKDL